MLKPRKCKVLDRMRSGETVNCFKVNLDSSRVVEMAAISEFDCIWTCSEHTANDYALIERQILAAKAYDADIIVRVARGSYSDLIRALELDASGIMVPHVMSAEDAREIAYRTRFHPIGLRPADGGNADGQFCFMDFADYIKFVNKNRMVIIQIEDIGPMDELDEICSVDGIDMIFFGPGDFSNAIGVPGQITHPEVQAARKEIAAVARKHGKLAGTTGSPATFNEYKEMGYQFINVGADVHAQRVYSERILKELAEGSSSTKPGGNYG
jgi:4-hydroxy-2-oxoheptanedioate aldolase